MTAPALVPNGKILIVDDHPPTRQMLMGILASAGLRVDCVADGAEALKYLGSNRPELVLTDYIMPHVDGLMLMRSITQRSDLRTIPVIMLSAVTTDSVRDNCAQNGVAKFISKPVERHTVLNTVLSVLERCSSPTIPPQPRAPVELPRLEYELLS